jgi:CheY-like chemotaxis protein
LVTEACNREIYSACQLIRGGGNNNVLARVKPVRILVVDDDPDSAQTFAMLLGTLGYEARCLTDPALALRTAQLESPQVVFLDLHMPGINGWALARMLRTELSERVWLVALSGHGTTEDRKRSREAGFDAHVQKPIDIELLRSTLAQMSYSRF